MGWVVQTVAGGGPKDLIGTQVGIGLENAIAVDRVGNLYLGGIYNSIYRLTAAGRIGIFAGVGGGNGAFDGDNVPATSANITFPAGMAVDAAGNLFFADQYNRRIRRVDANTNVITTIAGTGIEGSRGDGGPAMLAQFREPGALAFDASGNLYIADSADQRIRLISAGTNTITTVAGRGVAGFSGDGGPAKDATINRPMALAVDPAGNLYIADSGNMRVRKVAGTVITTIAGNGTKIFSGDGGPAINAGFSSLPAIAADGFGFLYIPDDTRLRRVTLATGMIATVAGSAARDVTGDGGPAAAATFSDLQTVAIDAAGNIFLRGGLRIREIDRASGMIKTVAGNGTVSFGGDGGPATSVPLGNLKGITTDASGNLYICDYSTVRKITIASGLISTVAGNGTSGLAVEFRPATQTPIFDPWSPVIDANGNLYFIESHRIVKVSASTGLLTFVANRSNARGYSGDGAPAIFASFNDPGGLALDSAGNLYVADTYNHRVRMISAITGLITTVVGNGAGAFNGEGLPALATSLNLPYGLALDADGNLFIADSSNNRVRKLTVATGIVTTVAGDGTFHYSDRVPATATGVFGPEGLAIDKNRVLYIVDFAHLRVRQVSGGIITTIGGTGEYRFSGDGGSALNAAMLPRDLAIDGAGRIYFTDADTRVRVLLPGATAIVATDPAGLTVNVDNVTYTAPATFIWAVGSSHVISVAAPQASNGTRNLFKGWNDGGSLSHSVTAVPGQTVYLANFVTQNPKPAYADCRVRRTRQSRSRRYDHLRSTLARRFL